MAELISDKVIVTLDSEKSKIVQKGFGEKKEKDVLLSHEEALFLLEKKWIIIKKNKKELNYDQFLKLVESEKNFYNKYLVFKDLRERGFIVKTGFKFGFNFRVYPRGKKPGEEHSKWVVQVQGQEKNFSTSELSRMIRLSLNLKTTLLYAIVDNEGDINYYEFNRVTP